MKMQLKNYTIHFFITFMNFHSRLRVGLHPFDSCTLTKNSKTSITRMPSQMFW